MELIEILLKMVFIVIFVKCFCFEREIFNFLNVVKSLGLVLLRLFNFFFVFGIE